MIITAKVVADSIHYLAGRRNPRRLTSFVLRFPRYALPNETSINSAKQWAEAAVRAWHDAHETPGFERF